MTSPSSTMLRFFRLPVPRGRRGVRRPAEAPSRSDQPDPRRSFFDNPARNRLVEQAKVDVAIRHFEEWDVEDVSQLKRGWDLSFSRGSEVRAPPRTLDGFRRRESQQRDPGRKSWPSSIPQA